MVQIIRTGGPQTVTVTGPKKGPLSGILEPAAQGLSRGLGMGLSESFQEYFDEQKEKKYNSIVDEALAKYSENGEGEVTPKQLLEVSYDRKLNLRDKDRDRLQQEAQTMAVAQKNQQLEDKQKQLQATTITPQQEEIAISTIRSLNLESATAADAYNSLRKNAGLNQKQAKPFVDNIFIPEKKKFENQHKEKLKNIDYELKSAQKAAQNNPRDKSAIDTVQKLLANRSNYLQNYRQKQATGSTPIQRGMNFGIQNIQDAYQPTTSTESEMSATPSMPSNNSAPSPMAASRKAELQEFLRGGGVYGAQR